MDHFEILGLTVEFDLNVSSLSIKYRELQREYHPDNFATASEVEKRLALQKSALINDAYQSLINPISRAEHILALNGHSLKDEQQSMKDMDFLMQQMALRERLEDIEQSEDEQALSDFSDEIAGFHRDMLSDLSLKITEKSWDKAAELVRKMKFLTKLQNEVERIEERFF